MYNAREYNHTNITTNVTTAIFTGKGILQAITINTAAAGTIIIKDGTVVVGTIKASAAEGTYWYNTTIAANLSVVTAASTDITVTWTQ